MSPEAMANLGRPATRNWFWAAIAALCAAVALGAAVAYGQASVLLAASAIVIVAAVISLGSRAFWVLPWVALGVAAVPHGAAVDVALSWHIAGGTIHSSDFPIALGILATACVALTVKQGQTADEHKWVVALGMFFLVQACAVAWGLFSGNSARLVFQDVRPLLGYALGLGGIALGRHERGVGFLGGAIVTAATITAGITIAVSSGMLSWGVLATETGRFGIRNGIVWIIAIPLVLQYALLHGVPMKLRIAFGALFLVNLSGLAWSGTRTLWLAVAVTLVYQTALLVRTDKLRLTRKMIIVGCAVMTLATIVTLPLISRSGGIPDPIARRLSTAGGLGGDSSLATRVVNYSKTNAVIGRSPLLGGGLGTRIVLYGPTGTIHQVAGQYVDNVPQTILLKSGLLGLAAFAFLFFTAAAGVGRAAKQTGNPLMVSAQASVPGLMILMLSSAFLFVWAELGLFALVWGASFGMLGRTSE